MRGSFCGISSEKITTRHARRLSALPLQEPWGGSISAVRIHRELMSARRVKGMHFWSRGYCVSTVGLDERTVREYIRHQEEEEKRQLDLGLE